MDNPVLFHTGEASVAFTALAFKVANPLVFSRSKRHSGTPLVKTVSHFTSFETMPNHDRSS